MTFRQESIDLLCVKMIREEAPTTYGRFEEKGVILAEK